MKINKKILNNYIAGVVDKKLEEQAVNFKNRFPSSMEDITKGYYFGASFLDSNQIFRIQNRHPFKSIEEAKPKLKIWKEKNKSLFKDWKFLKQFCIIYCEKHEVQENSAAKMSVGHQIWKFVDTATVVYIFPEN